MAVLKLTCSFGGPCLVYSYTECETRAISRFSSSHRQVPPVRLTLVPMLMTTEVDSFAAGVRCGRVGVSMRMTGQAYGQAPSPCTTTLTLQLSIPNSHQHLTPSETNSASTVDPAWLGAFTSTHRAIKAHQRWFPIPMQTSSSLSHDPL